MKEKDPIKIKGRSWSHKNQIIYSHDYFKTERILLTGGNEFALTTYYMYAARLDSDGNRKLVMSRRDQ